ncbi:MAG: class I SAM-dependent methyltransferase [Moorea sp. SIO3I7]|nr:class I SAM-dependent methyltransferase [Moorena sp. SIO3I7]
MEVLELASGSGRFSINLLEKGAQVTGIEIDAGMLNQARVKLSDWLKKGQLELIHGDIRRFELKRQFDIAFLSGEVLGEISEVEDRYRAFQCISTHLKPGARLLIITDNPGYYLQGGYRRTITRSRQLPDGNLVKMTEDRS